jgi:outer membrane protein assembly factor BamB
MKAGGRWGVLLLLAGAIAACSGGDSGPTCSYDDPAAAAVSSPWPKFHHDEQNTGAVANVQLSGTPTCRWVFPPGGADSCSTALTTPGKGAFAASPVISNDGSRIYIGSADGTLYALNTSDGTQLASEDFSFSTSEPIGSTALVARRAEGEVVFVGSGAGLLYGLTSTGGAQAAYWPNGIGGFISASPSLEEDGTVFVNSMNGTFTGVCPNGIARFALTGWSSQSSPAKASGGTLYFGADDRQLHAVEPNGIIDWSFSAWGPIRAAPVFDTATYSIYVADQTGRVFKVEEDGRPDLSFAFGPAGPISSSPALAEDHLYFGSDDGNLYVTDKCTGALAWQFATAGAVRSSPAVAIITSEPLQPTTCSAAVHQRIVVVGSDDGYVYFLQDNGTSVALVTAFSIGAPVSSSSPAIGSDGTVYIGASDGRVYAIGEPLASPAPSS